MLFSHDIRSVFKANLSITFTSFYPVHSAIIRLSYVPLFSKSSFTASSQYAVH